MTLLAIDRTDGALLVSIAAILVAIGSLYWQIYEAFRVDRARIDVKVNDMVAGLPTGNTSVVIVEATNRGKRPARLSFLGLGLVPHVPWHRRITRWQRRRIQAGMLVPNFGDVALPNSSLPMTLDVGEAGHALFRREHVLDAARRMNATTMQGIANSTAPGSGWSRGVPVPSDD